MKKIIQFLCILFIVSSCTVRKTNYVGGVKFEWKKFEKKASGSKKKSENHIVLAEVNTEEFGLTEMDMNIDAEYLSAFESEIAEEFPEPASETILTEDDSHFALIKQRDILKDVQSLFEFVGIQQTKNMLYEQQREVVEQETHWGAVAGFISGIVSLIIAGIPLGILAIIFSSIAMGAKRSNPERYKGNGLAVAGLILGIIGIVGALIFIATMV